MANETVNVGDSQGNNFVLTFDEYGSIEVEEAVAFCAAASLRNVEVEGHDSAEAFVVAYRDRFSNPQTPVDYDAGDLVRIHYLPMAGERWTAPDGCVVLMDNYGYGVCGEKTATSLKNVVECMAERGILGELVILCDAEKEKISPPPVTRLKGKKKEEDAAVLTV
jgi:hypothetical protein